MFQPPPAGLTIPPTDRPAAAPPAARRGGHGGTAARLSPRKKVTILREPSAPRSAVIDPAQHEGVFEKHGPVIETPQDLWGTADVGHSRSARPPVTGA
ncbi:Eukaryotic translation initiation factor 3 110 kDa subunit [Rhodovastum atsumiense]|nr:Eukaryotic translation initiation factor 3 110 kDa subunit [Rhodovastum atsumiense]